MIDLFKQKIECSGCGACSNICIQNAISMVADSEGFLYPQIDQNHCIECEQCLQVCPLKNKGDVLGSVSFKQKVYGAKHLVSNVLTNSSSGGVFTSISDWILQHEGTIYGAVFSNKFHVQHTKATTANERDKLRGSKYVQSNMKMTHQYIKDDLKEDKYVLFTGTPCQAAGLRNYLKNIDTSKLSICDIICHGVASPLLWSKYLEVIQKKVKSPIKEFHFRYKPKGWRGQKVLVQFENGLKRYNDRLVKIYSKLYSRRLSIRPACYNCKYANLFRPSDITIGDCWGIEKIKPEFEAKNGVSLVLTNTTKGNELFNKIKDSIEYFEIETDDYLQNNLRYPTKPAENRDQFWRDYYKHGFDYVVKRYADYNLKGRIKDAVKVLLKRM